MKYVYVVVQTVERYGVGGDPFILDIYANKDDALEEARSWWTSSLKRPRFLDGEDSVVDAYEGFSEEMGIWRFVNITTKFHIEYEVIRREVKKNRD